MSHAHSEEMVFVLLSRDIAAPVAIRAWVAERLRLGKNVESDAQIVEALACATTMECEGRKWVGHPEHYPFGMGDESRRLHREYNRLVREQEAGARNGAEVRNPTAASGRARKAEHDDDRLDGGVAQELGRRTELERFDGTVSSHRESPARASHRAGQDAPISVDRHRGERR